MTECRWLSGRQNRGRKWSKGARGGELEGDQRRTFCYPHSVSSVLYRKLAEEKYEEVHTRRRELRSRHFQKVSVDVLNVRNTLLFL